jgi:hypothetical protein
MNASLGEMVRELKGKGVRVPETFELCGDIVAPGGCIANIGVQSVTHRFPLGDVMSL